MEDVVEELVFALECLDLLVLLVDLGLEGGDFGGLPVDVGEDFGHEVVVELAGYLEEAGEGHVVVFELVVECLGCDAEA